MDNTNMHRVADARKRAIEKMAEAILDFFIEAAPASQPASYSSKNLPPGVVSPRAYRARARLVRGARRVGRDWIVDVGAWDAHFAASLAKPKLQLAPPPVGDDVDSLLAAGGVKLKRGAR